MRLPGAAALVTAGLLSACAGITAAPLTSHPTESELEGSLIVLPQDLNRQYYAAGANQYQVLDTFMSKRFGEIDLQFTDFIKALTRDKNLSSIATDLALLGLSGAIATGLNPQTAQTLGAISTAVAGGRASIDENVFINEALAALKTQMIARRNTVRARVAERLVKMQDGQAYPLLLVQADVQDYFLAGTIRGALDQTVQDAGTESARAQAKVDAQVFEVVRTEQGLSLAELLASDDPDLAYNQARVDLANACVGELGIEGTNPFAATGIGVADLQTFLFSGRTDDLTAVAGCVEGKIQG